MDGSILSATILALLLGLGLVATFAHVADRRGFGLLIVLLLGCIDLLALPVGLLYVVVAFVPDAGGALTEAFAGTGIDSAALMGRLPWVGWLVLVAALAGLVLLVPPLRRLIARLLPIDPERSVHVVALHYAIWLAALSLGSMLIPLSPSDAELAEMSRWAEAGGLGMLWAQACGFVIVGVLGVGWGVTRGGRETLDRLGLRGGLHVRWWLAATLAALLCGVIVDALWTAWGSESMVEVQRLSEALMRPFLEAGLWGAITIALSAGVGEEILFRGAAQPRLGLLTTTLLFALVHTQYTLSPALVQVFAVGLLLGLTRRRANTSTAIAVHASYNLILVLLVLYAPDLSP